MNVDREYLKRVIKQELESLVREHGHRPGLDPLTEGAIQDFAKKWGLPIALAGSIMATPGCASSPFSKYCDFGSSSSAQQTQENPRKEMIKIMRKNGIKSFLMDGEVSLGYFTPAKHFARKYPNLRGGVDVSEARGDLQKQQLIVLKKAVGEI